jgi:hypothetical protein
MNLTNVGAHLLNILHGAGASLAWFTLLSLGGLAVLSLSPGRLLPSAAEQGRPELGGYPGIVGATAYVLWCWYGVQLGFGLTPLVIAFTAVLLGVILIRARVLACIVKSRVDSRTLLAWSGAFIMFYVVAYLFFTPDLSGTRLPLATYLNNDLMNYLNITRAFQERGPSNVAGVSFLTSPVYLQTPAAFYVIALLSAFFRHDAMHAAMPLQFSLSAGMALLAARISRSVFRVSWPWALALGATVISGPFFRYVAGNYFLSTLLTVPILLNLLWITITSVEGRRRVDLPLALCFAAHYVLLLLTYPVLLTVGLAVQVGMAAAAAVASASAWRRYSGAWREAGRLLTRAAVVVALGLAATATVAPQHVFTAAESVLYLSKVGVAGWPMRLIAPTAIFGWPGHFDRVQVDSQGIVYAIAVLVAVPAALLITYGWGLRSRATLAERLLVVAGAGSLLLYCAAYWRLGPSYQQWKLASYLPLPLSFVAFAAVIRLFRQDVRAHAGRGWRTWLGRGLAALFAVVFVGGNLRVHATIEPRPWTFPSALAKLSTIDELPYVEELYVEMKDVRNTFLPVYFIRSKTLHLISPSYYPHEPLALDRISRKRPYLLQDFGCEGVGHDSTMTIDGVGCLMFAPPSPELDTPYPFNRTFHFVRPAEGIGHRESWGRWNNRRQAQLRLNVDSLRIPSDRVLFLNLRLAPYLPPGTGAQRVGFRWGINQAVQAGLASEGWFAFRLQPGDWTGVRVKTVTMLLDMPGATAPADVEPGSRELRPLAVAFKELILSLSPKGTVLESGTSQSRLAASY